MKRFFVSGGRWTGRFAAVCLFLTQLASAQTAIATVVAGTNPDAVAVNPVTKWNKPYSVALDLVTNKIYVANFTGDNVTVIDGATNTTAIVARGNSPDPAAVNPFTNTIYVTDGQEAGPTQVNGTGSPLVGNIQADGFLVLPGAVSQITVGTNIPGPAFTVDGTLYTSAQTFAWNAGDTHTIATTSPQAGSPGTQFVFAQWSDGSTSQSETITVPNVATSYIANFSTQYLLTVAANPPGAGTVSGGGYFNANAVVPISASPNGSEIFISWTGSIASPGSPSTTVTMTGPQSVVANFQVLVSQTIAFNSIPLK